MKKMITLLSITLLALASCSKEDSKSTTTTPETFILPKKIVSTKDGGTSSTSIITYNGNKIIEYSEGIYTGVYTYTGNLITKEVSSEGPENINEISYTYENNKLKNFIEIETNTNATTGEKKIFKTKTVIIESADSNTITEEHYKIDIATGLETKEDRKTVKTFSNGNLITEVNTSTSVSNDSNGVVTSINTITTTYEYDTKNYFLKNVLGFDKLYRNESSNNLIKETSQLQSTRNGIANPPSLLGVRNYIYKYDTNGYPIEKMYTYLSNIDLKTTTTQYFY
jgi:hypothetical protein